MKLPTVPAACAGTLLLVLTAGCGSGNNPPPAATTPEQAVPTMEATFEGAPEEARQEVQTAITAIQSQDDTAAYLSLESLSQKKELTPEQRQAMTEAWMAVNRRLAAAASNGNENAEALLNRYRSSK